MRKRAAGMYVDQVKNNFWDSL